MRSERLRENPNKSYVLFTNIDKTKTVDFVTLPISRNFSKVFQGGFSLSKSKRSASNDAIEPYNQKVVNRKVLQCLFDCNRVEILMTR